MKDEWRRSRAKSTVRGRGERGKCFDVERRRRADGREGIGGREALEADKDDI
jgi:hypothetical protein